MNHLRLPKRLGCYRPTEFRFQTELPTSTVPPSYDHSSPGNAGSVSPIVYPLLEQNDRDFAQSKGFRAVPENQTLTDVLEQQEAGPVIRERITNRSV